MRVHRYFTQMNSYENMKFELRESQLRDIQGREVKKSIFVTVPKNWSQIAVDIIAQKYLRKTGIPIALKKVEESNVPKWLWRSVPDDEKLNNMNEKDRYVSENDARQVFHRLAGTWTYEGWRAKYFSSEEDALHFYEELCHMLANQIAAPNSPQFFNTGLYWAYGIKGPAQGHSYIDQFTGELKKSESAYERPQPHACFIQSIEDNLLNEGGIFDLLQNEARVFKYGSGSGTNFSSLRGSGESLSGGGISSGLLSFLQIFDRAAGAIKSGGTTRRAAKMVSVDIDHPDIEDFIQWKTREEKKIVSLVAGSKLVNRHVKRIEEACKDFENQSIACDPKKNQKLAQELKSAYEAGVPAEFLANMLASFKQGIWNLNIKEFSTDWNDEAYTSISGQNSNNSIRINDDFMHKLENDEKFNLVRRTDGNIQRTIKAKDLWWKIAHSAWACADPGLQFNTTINDWHTCPNSGDINGSNPCSEYMFLDDTACNLASINLIHFNSVKDGKWNFDLHKFAHAARLWTIVLEISVMMAQYPTAKIAINSYKFRTLGLGYANLGALFMRSGIAYDSQTAFSTAAYITAVMHGVAYETSADMAAEFGAFSEYSLNKAFMQRVIQNHANVVNDQPCDEVKIQPQVNWKASALQDMQYLKNIWNRVLDKGAKYGFRNAQVTLLAPTGTIGLLMDCDTTGLEPDFALVKYKKLAGAGYMKIVNHSVEPALRILGYSQNQINDIQLYMVGHGNINDAPHVNAAELLKKGLLKTEIDKINDALRTAFDIRTVFSPWVLGESTFDRLNLSIDEDCCLLSHLGFSKNQIDEANTYVCGTFMIEGAPHIKDEHLPIFDTANRCGKGERCIDMQAHINMMAFVQPFLSGSISKTINMPFEATLKDCSDAYLDSWKLGLKAIALYRDGSKLSQALTSMQQGTLFEVLNDANSKDIEVDQPVDKKLLRGEKEILPKRRRGYTQKISIGGYDFYHTTGEGYDDDVKEVFTTGMGTEGASFRGLMNCFARALSIGLQYGVPLEAYIKSFTFSRFEPSGPVSGHSKIKYATSLIDYLMRDLGISYRKMKSLGHVEGESENEIDNSSNQTEIFTNTTVKMEVSEDNQKEKKISNLEKRVVAARMQGYTGDACEECNEFSMKRVGSCLTCDACGSNTGCS